VSDLRILRHGTHFTIGIRTTPEATVVAAFGLPMGWELANIPTSIDAALPEDWTRLIFDLSKADFADSGLLNVVGAHWKATREDPRRQVCIVALPGTTIHEKLVLSGISRRVPVVSTMAEALSADG